MEINTILNKNLEFSCMVKTLPTKGNLAYEYNPFRNYRINKLCYRYNNKLLTAYELLGEFGKTIEVKDGEDKEEKAKEYILEHLLDSKTKSWTNIPTNLGIPELLEPGELVDFETDELKFDLNHPVDILPQYSYDGSVNLIINDGTNIPRLINSRFSALGRNEYQIVDRKGSNDTNIYDQGNQFDIDTSLYKRVTEIPRLKFLGMMLGGKMPIGNYHFYFRYADADGNETDFVAESGLVSIFIGNLPTSIYSGFRDEDSHKGVKFQLSNIDAAYLYVNVYYTRASSDINENSVTTAKRINQKFLVSNTLKCSIVITGYEDVTEITIDEINPTYQLFDSVNTQASCQNMLFLGNVKKPNIEYEDLADVSLRFLPFISQSKYPLQMDKDYLITVSLLGYYDPKYIYNNVGYWNHELYRLGVVYILSNNELSPVFNIRGLANLKSDSEYTLKNLYNTDGKRNYIEISEDTYNINPETGVFENSKGVIQIEMPTEATQQVYGIDIQVPKDVVDYLKNTLKIKGFFFVRQKRIPTILCQAYTIGIDLESHTPVLPVGSSYVAERFIDNNKKLTHDFTSRLYTFEKENKVRTQGAICPEYDVDTAYYNSLFTGGEFTITYSDILPAGRLSSTSDRNYKVDATVSNVNTEKLDVKIIGLEDNVKLEGIGDYLFAGRAGEAEEAFRYEYLESENKVTKATNLVRGSYGPYLGIVGLTEPSKLIDIRIPGYSEITTDDLFKIRYNDKSPFYAISDRIDINAIDDWFNISDDRYFLINPLHRGDCYICQFTHRLNRNFQDPSAPVNDKIVDEDCWNDNYEVEDGILKVENFDDINLGDVNAVKLGMWVTMPVRSTKNLNIRALDESIPDEVSLTGHGRGFYPLHPLSPDGTYKTPESLCYNKGFEKSVSERYNMEVPDVPAIKNDFTNRISYSDIHVNDAFKNGFRTFLGTHYRDYPKTYGLITKLVEFRGNLICIFEHGIALISVNERAVAGEGSSGNIYINTSNVLPENPMIISDTFGSQWKDSIIKTPIGIYGIDTTGKKIWRTNGQTFECISDFKVLEFLNNNITLTERELNPIIGVRNVKTHYNKFKHDVMFTFYDNLYGFEEKVWNLCYSEILLQWTTFYSWVPSYSENIYNQFFSFDRNTSKWITKLGISLAENSFSDGVVLSNNVISINKEDVNVGTLSLSNRNLPSGTNIEYEITYTLEHDNNGNWKCFKIEGNQLLCKTAEPNLRSEYFVRKVVTNSNDMVVPEFTEITDLSDPNLVKFWKSHPNLPIAKDDNGIRKTLDTPYQTNKIVYLLNIKAEVKAKIKGGVTPSTLEEEYINGFNNGTQINAGYYQSVVAVIPEYNKLFLTTDFWKHGLAGIIDIADTIEPCKWYGKQHPFEFEFVVSDNPMLHKIFDNLEIISNSAEPESFHYEIIGDSYNFANDKQNMYVRQEATKELYLYNGSDVLYDSTYSKITTKQRKIDNSDNYEASTLIPLYYSRRNTINEIEDSYSSKDGSLNGKDYSALAGGEIKRYKTLDEYHIWNHAKAVDMVKYGRMRGNMLYKEDRWDIQINPLNLIYNNEPKWGSEDITSTTETLNSEKIPIELGQSPIPSEVKETIERGDTTIPPNSTDRAIVQWNWKESLMKEAKIKDKWVKIKIRYKGDKLAIISAINTLYSISFA